MSGDRPERVIALDLVRGFAVLGIQVMNILSIGLPAAAHLNPLLADGFSGLDQALWWIGYLFFDEKMIALFSMLFGAGPEGGRNSVLTQEMGSQYGFGPIATVG